MPQEDSDQLSDIDSQSGAEGFKRKAAVRREDKTDTDQAKDKRSDLDDLQADVEPNPKRQRTDRAEPVFEVSMVALNGLTSAIQRLSGEVTRTRENHEKTERALVDVTCALSKCTDAINRFKNVLEENAKEERRREERWIEMDRVREEEQRKDREAEQRREVRRREAERKDREELRKLLAEMKEETRIKQKGEDVVKNGRTMERMERTMVENNVLVSKMVDTMTRLKNVLESNEKEERRREERRQEADRRKEEDRRKEREEERRREERRRESERRDREEKRRMETGGGCGHKEDRRKEERREEADKRRKQDQENEPRVKSVLGRSYTENAINDYGRKK